MKKIVLILFFGLLLLGATGCSSKSENSELVALKEEVNNLKKRLESTNNIDISTHHEIENSNLDELKKLVEESYQKIDSLDKDKKTLEEQVKKLQEANTTLSSKIESFTKDKETLEGTIKELKNTNSTLSSKVSNLENSTNTLKNTVNTLGSHTTSSSSNQYTIFKNQLIGNWKQLNGTQNLTFTDSNVDVVGNWIIYNGNLVVYYMYKDNKLFVSDDGPLLVKQ